MSVIKKRVKRKKEKGREKRILKKGESPTDFRCYLLSCSLSGGKLYTASQVLVDPGMQNPKEKSKLLTS